MGERLDEIGHGEQQNNTKGPADSRDDNPRDMETRVMTLPHDTQPRRPGWARRALSLALGAALAGCVTFGPGGAPPGTPMADVIRSYGAPSARYETPGGWHRLVYASGSFGKLTYMLDFDPQDKLVKNEQVLTEANFAEIKPGMSSQEVQMRIGPPQDVMSIPRQGIVVWSYRFFRGDCVWFQTSIDNAGTVKDAGITSDPICDHGPDRE
jgi:hypothetical protein